MLPTKKWTTRRRSSVRFAAARTRTHTLTTLNAHTGTPRIPRLASAGKALTAIALGAALVLPAAGPAAALTDSGPSTPVAPGPSAPGSSIGPNTATFGVQPVTGDKPDSRARLTYDATPGARIADHVAVQNFGTQPLQLHVYANDAFNTGDGGFDIQASAVPPKDVGGWVHLAGTTFVTVPPRAMVIVPITITIPINATPGDHAGGIVAGLDRMATDAKGNRVNVEERVGTRIYVRVPGKLSAALALTNVRTTYHNSLNPIGSGTATVTYTVRNTGNVRLAGAVHVNVSSFIGGSKQAAPNVAGEPLNLPSIKELLPGQQLTFSTRVGGVFPSFVTTGRVTVDPSALPGDIDPKASSVSQSASTAAVPWALLILIILLGGLTFEFIRRRRRPVAPVAPVTKKTAATKSAGPAAPAKNAAAKTPAKAAAARTL